MIDVRAVATLGIGSGRRAMATLGLWREGWRDIVRLTVRLTQRLSLKLRI